jgi:hypothetical protein
MVFIQRLTHICFILPGNICFNEVGFPHTVLIVIMIVNMLKELGRKENTYMCQMMTLR